jgi:hypothetical protein
MNKFYTTIDNSTTPQKSRIGAITAHGAPKKNNHTRISFSTTNKLLIFRAITDLVLVLLKHL